MGRQPEVEESLKMESTTSRPPYSAPLCCWSTMPRAESQHQNHCRRGRTPHYTSYSRCWIAAHLGRTSERSRTQHILAIRSSPESETGKALNSVAISISWKRPSSPAIHRHCLHLDNAAYLCTTSLSVGRIRCLCMGLHCRELLNAVGRIPAHNPAWASLLGSHCWGVLSTHTHTHVRLYRAIGTCKSLGWRTALMQMTQTAQAT